MELRGYLKRIIFQNEDNMYTIAKVSPEENMTREQIVIGTLPAMEKYSLYTFVGDFVENQKYGKQFKVDTFSKVAPTDRESIIKFLASPLFEGIGKKSAELIYDSFGEDTIEEIKKDWTPLVNLKGISETTAIKLHKKLNEGDVIVEAMQLFIGYGLGIHNVGKLAAVYGSKLLDVLKTNPYQITRDVDTISFKQCDMIALKSGYDMDSVKRYSAAMYHALENITFETGDTYTSKEHLFSATASLCDGPSNLFDEAYEVLLKTKLVIDLKGRIFPYDLYHSEQMITSFLTDMLTEEEVDLRNFDNIISGVENDSHISYSPEQKNAIETVMRNKFTILTGGPGTGKTQTTKAILQAYKHMTGASNNRIALCAPTGRAARRMSEVSLMPAKSIHSLLEWDLHSQKFGIDRHRPLEVDFIVIDEFSMVDTKLFAALLDASINVKKILIVGDENQLPSVGPGALLRDLIAADKFNVERLSKIFRQAEQSGIINLAYAVNEGVDKFDFDSFDDIKFFNVPKYSASDNIVKIVKSALEKGSKIDEVQVLAPMYNSVIGIDTINEKLQNFYIDDKSDPFESGTKKYYKGDKILQLKNDYEQNVVNGDIGYLSKIIKKDENNPTEKLTVRFDNNLVEYSRSDVAYPVITHGYCTSVHKAQGSEYDIVILPIFKDYGRMLERKLLYTAVTRAKKFLILLGDERAFYDATHRILINNRKTGISLHFT